jgi:CRP/FNR family transcriptional regulator, cyclic AMP receptor protein
MSLNLDELIIDKRAVLARHEFFCELPPAVIERLAAHARLSTYCSGQPIFRKGEEGLGLIAVLSGVVKISTPSAEGKEITLNLIGPNEIFGEIALLDGGPRTADATAMTRCQLLKLDRRDFASVLQDEPTLAIRLLALVARRLRQTSEQVEDITFADPPKRLAKALLRLADMQGAPEGHHVRIAITQKELGRTVGLSRESTNKWLRDWEDAGYVTLEKGACIIRDRGFLEELLSDPC